MKLFIFALMVAAVAGSLVGGWTEQDASDSKYLDMAWGASGEINKEHSGGDKALVPRKIITARSQVVAGVNYEVEVEMAESDCSKNDVPTADKCHPEDNSEGYVYTFRKFEQPWTNTEEFSVVKKP